MKNRADMLKQLTEKLFDYSMVTSHEGMDKEEVVVQAVKEAGLEVLEVNCQGEWVSVIARKK